MSDSRLSILPSDQIGASEVQGHQLTPEELVNIWDQPLIVLNQNNVFTHSNLESVPWKPWSGSIHAFGLLTTMGVDTLSPSHGGRAFTVIYTLFGFPLYFCIIAIWSRRLFHVLKIISKGRGSSKIRNNSFK
ncbi:hypothetical protein Avbf_10610 [Armadillidium vulgare]|nr:hypothetical protein Avbf_10610 [Armadillidium vulgare]